MTNSNAEWGRLAATGSGLAAIWDRYDPLPDPGVNPALDALCAAKHIAIGDLVRVGARLRDADTLAYAQDRAIAYRSLTTGQRWFEEESRPSPVLVRAAEPADTCIIAEGQTDGARLSALYPDADVLVLPNGARRFKRKWAKQLASYELVLVALDNDDAGHAGAEKITRLLPEAVRWLPPSGNDWCEFEGEPPSYASVVPGDADFLDFWDDDDDDAPLYVIDGLYARSEVVLLAADTGAGKSFLALSQAVAVARGIEWLGRPTEQGVVLYVDEENPKRIPRSRARGLGIRHAPAGSIKYASRRGLTVGDGADSDAWLRRKLERIQPSLVFIDTAQAATAVADVNSNSEVAELYRKLRPLAEEFDCCIVILHHERKLRENESRSASQATLGARQWVGQSDSHITLRRLPRECTDETDAEGIRHLRTVIEVEYPKLRDDVPPQKGKLAIVSRKDGNYLLTDSVEVVTHESQISVDFYADKIEELVEYVRISGGEATSKECAEHLGYKTNSSVWKEIRRLAIGPDDDDEDAPPPDPPPVLRSPKKGVLALPMQL